MSRIRKHSRLLRLVVLIYGFALCGCANSTRVEPKALRLARDAEVAYQSGEFELAKKRYELLLKMNPRYAAAHLRLGAIAYREGDVSAARAQFEIAARKDPKNAQAKYNLAMLSLNDATQLLNEYSTLTAQAPDRERVRVLLSHLREFERK